MGRVQCDVVYPAPEAIIRKYTKQSNQILVETAQVYNEVVKPHFIEPMNMDHCNWVYAMLDNEKEVDLRVYEHPEFYLQKDYKFNEGDPSTLYCLAVPR